MNNAFAADVVIDSTWFQSLEISIPRKSIPASNMPELLSKRVFRDAGCGDDANSFMEYSDFCQYIHSQPAVFEWFNAIATLIQQSLPIPVAASIAEHQLRQI